MVIPKITPVHGRSVVRVAGLIIFRAYSGGMLQVPLDSVLADDWAAKYLCVSVS